MSDTNQDLPAAQVEEEAPSAEAPADEVGELFEVHGKKFDLSKPEGKGELKGFLEAMSSELGRKNNEVGTLRKFAAAHKPDESEETVIKQARAKAQEGDLDAAIDAVFGYSKAKIRSMEARQAVKEQNDETWDTYLSSRPDLLKLFDKKTVRKVSETELNIYDAEDPFKVLDQFWLPKTAAATPAQTPRKKETPPATPSGGQARSTAAPQVSKPGKEGEKVDLLSFFDERSRPKRA